MVGSSGHKGISRIDSFKNNTHGWYVRVQYRGETHSRFFSDSAHGGEQKGLTKAIRERNRLERELGKPRTDRTVAVGVGRNNSGVQGIKRVPKGLGYAYEVTWSPSPGVVQRTSVSIQKHGEEEAFRRAMRIRQSKERKHFGGLITNDWPDAPPEAIAEKTKPARVPKPIVSKFDSRQKSGTVKPGAKVPPETSEKPLTKLRATGKAQAAARAPKETRLPVAAKTSAKTKVARTTRGPATSKAPAAKAPAAKAPAAKA
ncbi:MAG: hypothetical protein JWN98_1892, partial [Abditibacteriota bacterium]|nr:hypothetical protein [Abditibacteriota bacterium]